MTLLYGNGTCAIPRCPATTNDGSLMCRPHWRAVPLALQNAVWRAARRWQEGATLLALRDAQAAAVASVPVTVQLELV